MIKEFYRTGALIFLILTLSVTGVIIKGNAERELQYQKKRLSEFNILMNEYRALKEELSKTAIKAHRKALIDEINSLLNTTGLKGKVRTLKGSQVKETPFGSIEETELVMEKLTINEVANLFYQIDQRHLSINRLSIKRTFDSPELLNLTIMLSGLKGK